jgi:hypothetical protein
MKHYFKYVFCPTPEQLRAQQLARLRKQLVYVELEKDKNDADLAYLNAAIARLSK